METILSITRGDVEILLELIEEDVEVSKKILDKIIDKDQTPETVEEFLGLVDSQHERIARLEKLQVRLKGLI